MKKIYTIIALAALTAGSSVAAPRNVVKRNNVPQTVEQAVQVRTVNETAPKKATRALSSIEDVYGTYNGSGVSNLETTAGDIQNFSMVIGPSKKGGNTVSITNFPFSGVDEMEATVDIEAGTISIAPNQDAWFNQNYPSNYVEFITAPYGSGTMTPAVGTINGNYIEFPEEQYIGFGLNNQAGYFNLWTQVSFKKIVFFSYNESEWSDAGEVVYQDGWVNTGMEGTEYVVTPQKVSIKRSKTTEGLFLLMNPYKGNAWSEVNPAYTSDGYLLVDASNPDCVCVMPYVNSGYNGVPFGLDAFLTFYNQEGVDLDDDWSQAEQVAFNQELANQNGDSLRDYLSYWDAESNKITIFNAYFGTMEEPLAYYGWKDKDEKSMPIYSYITMPDDITPAGVSEVAADSNAPVKYYNLQGMEVVNPEAGQIIIKKQGSKTTKFVVK